MRAMRLTAEQHDMAEVALATGMIDNVVGAF
jgi:hypothetical protein